MINPTQLLNEGVFFVATKGYDLPNWFYRVEAFNQEMRIISLSTLFSEETHFVPMEKISLLHFAPGYQKLKERQEYDRITDLLKRYSAISDYHILPSEDRENIAKNLADGKIDELAAEVKLLEQQQQQQKLEQRKKVFASPAKKWWEFWK